MSLQDDIFDVRDALKGKPEAASFSRLEERLNEVEANYEEATKIISAVTNGARAIQHLLKERV